MEAKGHLIVIVAPSGTGKTSLLARLKEEIPEIVESVSWTTRPKRKGEREGVDYVFVSEEKFIQKRDGGGFLEWALVHSHYYGTPLEELRREYERGRTVLCDLDVQGRDSMKKAFPKARVIFIEPPSLADLERRLRGRGTDSEEVIALRLANAKRELESKGNCDYLIVNDNFERAYGELKEIVENMRENPEPPCKN
ncbi:MAG: guanylate kinase [Bacteriovoracales bacterium]|nr:guanylate kinase [Bacteriovoracales bacterium]